MQDVKQQKKGVQKPLRLFLTPDIQIHFILGQHKNRTSKGVRFFAVKCKAYDYMTLSISYARVPKNPAAPSYVQLYEF